VITDPVMKSGFKRLAPTSLMYAMDWLASMET
jgi:hypothetical protein